MKSKIFKLTYLLPLFVFSLLLVTQKPREAEASFTVNVSESEATITTSDIKKDQLDLGRKGFITVGFTVSVGTPEAYHGGGPKIYYDQTSYATRYFSMTSTATGNDFTDWSDVPAGASYTTTYKMKKSNMDAVLSNAGFTWEQFEAGECSLVFDAIVVSTTNEMSFSTMPPHVASFQDDRMWQSIPPIKSLPTSYYRYRFQNKYDNGIGPLVSWGDEEDHFEIVVKNASIGEILGSIRRPSGGDFPIRFGTEWEPRPWNTPSGANPLVMDAKPDLLATYNWDTENYYHIGEIPSNDISTDGIPSSGNDIKTSIHNGVVSSAWAGSTGARFHGNALDGYNDSYAFVIPVKFPWTQLVDEEVKVGEDEHGKDKYETITVEYARSYSGTAGFTLFLYYNYLEVGDFDFYDIYGMEVKIQDESKKEQLYPQFIEYYEFPQSIRLVTNDTAGADAVIKEIKRLIALEASTPTFNGKKYAHTSRDWTKWKDYVAPPSGDVVKDARKWFYYEISGGDIYNHLQPGVFYTTDATINIDGVDHTQLVNHTINTWGGYLKDGTVDSGYASVCVQSPGFMHFREGSTVIAGPQLPKVSKIEPEKIKGVNKCSENQIRQDAKNGPYWCELSAAYKPGEPEQGAAVSESPANLKGPLNMQRPPGSVLFAIVDTRGKEDAILQNMYYTTLIDLEARKEDLLLDEIGFKTPPLVSPQKPGTTYTYLQDEPIIIHTPVIVNVNIPNSENRTQLLGTSHAPSEPAGNGDPMTKAEGGTYKTTVNGNELRLDEWYTMQFNHEQHKKEGENTPGYYGADDRIIDDKFVLKKTFTFPFDVVYKKDGKLNVIKAGTETEIEKSDWKKFNFYIPSWSDTGLYGVAGKGDHIVLKVYASNSMRGNTEENLHNIHSPDEESTYIATYYIACQVSGWLYDFKATGINASYLYNIDAYVDENNPHNATALCPIKREKRVGQYNRKGTDWVRFEADGAVTHSWSEVNTLPFRRGVSNNLPGMGNLVRGNWFTFTLKTIDNLISEEDTVEITPTYRGYTKSGASMGTQGKDFQIYYWKDVGDETYLVEYGSEDDVMSDNYLGEGTYSSARLNYIWKLPHETVRGDGKTITHETNNFHQTYSYRILQGSTHKSTNAMVEQRTKCYSLSKITLNKDLKLYTGDKGQLFELFKRPSTEVNMTNTSSSGIFPEYLKDLNDKELFNQSMQTWYGKYYIPSTLVVVDLNKLKSEGYGSVRDYAIDHNGITGEEDFFVNEGYLMVNFDIRTNDDDEPENNLGYSSNDGGDSVWKNEQKGNPNPDPPGDPVKTPDSPSNPPKDIPPREPGDEDDPPEIKEGDVGFIELDPLMDVKNQYYVALWGIN